jgi:hypothetical protein
MGIFKRPCGNLQPDNPAQISLGHQEQLKESNRALADNPAKFAEWVYESCI